MVLIAVYEGFLTADITSPFPEQKLKTIDEALSQGFSTLIQIPSLNRDGIQKAFDGPIPVSETERQEYLKWLWVEIFGSLASYNIKFIAVFLFHHEPGEWSYPYRTNSTTKRRIYNSLTYNLSYDYVIEEELSLCNKTMIVDENRVLVRMAEEVHKYKSPYNFYLGEDSYLRHPNIFVIHNMIWDRFCQIYGRFQALIHSGIMSRIEKIGAPQGIQQREFNGKYEAVSISSSLSLSTFMIFSVLVFCCLAVLIAELFITGSQPYYFSRYFSRAGSIGCSKSCPFNLRC